MKHMFLICIVSCFTVGFAQGMEAPSTTVLDYNERYIAVFDRVKAEHSQALRNGFISPSDAMVLTYTELNKDSLVTDFFLQMKSQAAVNESSMPYDEKMRIIKDGRLSCEFLKPVDAEIRRLGRNIDENQKKYNKSLEEEESANQEGRQLDKLFYSNQRELSEQITTSKRSFKQCQDEYKVFREKAESGNRIYSIVMSRPIPDSKPEMLDVIKYGISSFAETMSPRVLTTLALATAGTLGIWYWARKR